MDFAHLKSDPLFDKIKEMNLYGITREIVEIYVKLCNGFKETKKITLQKPVKPIISHYPKDRVVIDLIEMTPFNPHKKRGDYNYILTVIDHYSNYTMLYPQKTKRDS